MKFPKIRNYNILEKLFVNLFIYFVVKYKWHINVYFLIVSPMLRYRSDSHPQECNDQGTWIIVPSIHIRPIWWTYANICIRSRMIRDIHNLGFLFPFGVSFSHIRVMNSEFKDQIIKASTLKIMYINWRINSE